MDANASSEGVVTAVIFEPRPRLAIALAKVLESSSIVRVIGRATDPGQTVKVAEALQPHVVLFNVDRPGYSLVESCQSLRLMGRVGIVLLSLEYHSEPLQEELASGAHAILTAPFHPRDLVLAVVQAALCVGSRLDPDVLRQAESLSRTQKDMSTGKLRTWMEWGAGQTAKEISPRLSHGFSEEA